jgi:hypothetical protein
LLTSGADRDKACRDTRKLLNPCHIRFSVFRELSIRCRIFDTGFIPAREGFKNWFAAIEELNIPAWEAGKGATSTCVTGADLDFFEASKDIEVADMNPCKAVYTDRVLERKCIQPAAAARTPRRRAVFMSTFTDSVAALIEELCRECP